MNGLATFPFLQHMRSPVSPAIELMAADQSITDIKNAHAPSASNMSDASSNYTRPTYGVANCNSWVVTVALTGRKANNVTMAQTGRQCHSPWLRPDPHLHSDMNNGHGMMSVHH